MPSEFLIVYQDCPTCGVRKKWGERTIKAALDAGVPIRKVSFASIEGQGHALKAIQNGIKSYPFVTDGKTYAKDIESLLQAESEGKKTKKTTKKTKKVMKGEKDGAISED